MASFFHISRSMRVFHEKVKIIYIYIYVSEMMIYIPLTSKNLTFNKSPRLWEPLQGEIFATSFHCRFNAYGALPRWITMRFALPPLLHITPKRSHTDLHIYCCIHVCMYLWTTRKQKLHIPTSTLWSYIAIKSRICSHHFHGKPVRLERRVTAGAEAGAGGTSKKPTASPVGLELPTWNSENNRCIMV